MTIAKDLLYLADPVQFAREKLGFCPDDKQQQVLRAHHRRGILNCSRQWGKSTVTAAMAVHRAFTHPGSLILVMSPSSRQSGEFLKKSSGFLRRLDIRPRGDGTNDMSLLLPNSSRIVGLPGVEGTARGFSAVSLLLIDEAARVPDDVYHSIRPMLAVGAGSLWLMSTPFGKRGFFHDTWVNGDASWLKVEAPAIECARIPAEFLDEERRTIGDRWFRQEYMCDFLEADDTFFEEAMLLAAFDEEISALRL